VAVHPDAADGHEEVAGTGLPGVVDDPLDLVAAALPELGAGDTGRQVS
jgi:hypothetical protein